MVTRIRRIRHQVHPRMARLVASALNDLVRDSLMGSSKEYMEEFMSDYFTNLEVDEYTGTLQLDYE